MKQAGPDDEPEVQTSEEEVRDAILKCLKILDGLPDNEVRARTMAMVATTLGQYDLAKKLLETAERFAVVKKYLCETGWKDDV